jgi:hypothetical protein
MTIDVGFNSSPRANIVVDAAAKTAVRNYRQELLANGFRPVPVKTREKVPFEMRWPERARMNPPPCTQPNAIVSDSAMNTGILCDGLQVVDVDVDDEKLSAEIWQLAWNMLGAAPYRTRAGTGRIALLYRAADGSPPKSAIKGPLLVGIDVLGVGQQVVVDGIHPSGSRLEWPEDGPDTMRRDDLLPVTENQVAAFLDACRPLIGAPAKEAVPPVLLEWVQPCGAIFPAEPREDLDFFRVVNDLAFASLASWVIALLPSARPQTNTAGYRVTSKALGRDLQEDLSITPQGIVDFGVADMGDPNEGRRTPITLVIEYNAASDAKGAAFWLCDRLGREPESLGWKNDDVELLAIGAASAEAIIKSDEEKKAAAVNAVSSLVEEWQEPTPIKSPLPPVMPYEDKMMPESMRGYVRDTSDRRQSPPDFVAVATLCSLAAVIGSRARVRPKQHDDWEVVPNLWGGIIGRPSSMKSPSLKSALAAAYAIQDRMAAEWTKDCDDSRIDIVMASLDAKDAHKRAEKASKAGDAAEARRILKAQAADAIRIAEGHPPKPRLIVNDATVEKLGELLNENPRGLLLERDELAGFLARMEDEERQTDRAFYLEAFNGDGRFTYDRIGRGSIEIENMTISMIGGIQPSRIAPLVRNALSGVGDDGLIQRFQMMVWPDDVPEWNWVDRVPNGRSRQLYMDAFWSLHSAQFQDEFGSPLVLRFSEQAQKAFINWNCEIQAEARSGKLPSVLESHVLKMPKTVASLALIFELVEGGREGIRERSMLMALDWADYLRSHANRLYAAGELMTAEGARLILKRRGKLPTEFTARDVYRREWGGLTNLEVVAAAIETLVETNHLRLTKTSPGPKGGQPLVTYRWHPSLAGEA